MKPADVPSFLQGILFSQKAYVVSQSIRLVLVVPMHTQSLTTLITVSVNLDWRGNMQHH